MKNEPVSTFFVFLFFAAAVSFGLTALPIKVMVETGRVAEFAPLYKGASPAAVALVPEAVSRPLHGHLDLLPGKTFHWMRSPAWVARRVTWFRYTPTAGFSGIDSFTYRVNDGAGSVSNTEKCVIRVHPGEPGGMKVLIVVNDSILPFLQTEVNRLKADIDSEGYSAVIKPYPHSQVPRLLRDDTAARKLWDTLRAEYDRAVPGLSGAILIGKLPGCPGSTNGPWDEAFWNLSLWLRDFIKDSIYFSLRDSVGSYRGLDTSSYAVYGTLRGLIGASLRHIWVTRMYGRDGWGNSPNAYGNEVVLIKRMLDANHNYRKGISRLPRTAWAINNWGGTTYNASKLASIWPDVRNIPKGTGPDTPVVPVYRSAGEMFDINSHGGTNYFSPNTMAWAKAVSDSFMEYPFQIRFYLASACHNAGCGNALNQHFFTRGGGAVFGTSAVEYVQSNGYFSFCYDTVINKTLMRSLIAGGQPWGRSWLNGNMPVVCQVFYGDGTMKAYMTPPNQLPGIRSITGTRVSANRMRIQVDAGDNDGSVALYEYWINRKYNRGRNEPDTAGASLGTLEFTFDSVTTVRLEVVDNYMARALAKFRVDPVAGTVNVNLTTGEETTALPPVSVVKTGIACIPNPFGGSIAVSGTVVRAGRLEARILSADGRLVRTLHSGNHAAGAFRLLWDGSASDGHHMASGMYIAEVRIPGRILRKTMLLTR